MWVWDPYREGCIVRLSFGLYQTLVGDINCGDYLDFPESLGTKS